VIKNGKGEKEWSSLGRPIEKAGGGSKSGTNGGKEGFKPAADACSRKIKGAQANKSAKGGGMHVIEGKPHNKKKKKKE